MIEQIARLIEAIADNWLPLCFVIVAIGMVAVAMIEAL